MYKNKEGYADPTAGLAMSRIMKEYKKKQKQRFANKNRKKVYVASKYAGDIEANVQAARKYCRRVTDEGYMPIASHLLYPQFLDDTNPDERELGLLFGLALLRLCDEVWVFGEVSPGVEKEIAEAKQLKKKLRFIKEV